MIFLLFIFIPIIEIAIFITVGSNIGILNTIAIILITALAGIYLVRKQGLSLLFNAQRNLSQGVMPTEEIKSGIFLLISIIACLNFLGVLVCVHNGISGLKNLLPHLVGQIDESFKVVIIDTLFVNGCL